MIGPVRARLKLFFDGGCRPNPGPIEIAVVTRGHAYIVNDLGPGSNSEAEWMAAIHALRIARTLGAHDVTLLGDSALVVAQANGMARCRGISLQAHLATFRALSMTFDRVHVRHVGRARNLAGIILARRHPR